VLLVSTLIFCVYQWHFTRTGDLTLPPLVLLHGWMGSCEDYAEIIELLKSQFDCIAIDLPGHGKTETTGGDLGFNFINTALGIIDLLDQFKIKHCSIAGYSFGGRLALYLALEFPDRFDQVILESTSPGLATAEDRRSRVIADQHIGYRLDVDSYTNFVKDWYRQPIFETINTHPNFPSLIQRRIKTNQVEKLAKSLQYAGLGVQPFLGDRLKIHARPMLLIVGELDRKFVDISQAIEQECPQVRLEIISDCSHNVHFQQPQAWVDCLLADRESPKH
jgi:2-succinyl-6-hydroxy-2,4-cyclohexadiene-1-carboxylate synthase